VKKDSEIWLAIPNALHEIIDPLSSSRYTLETEQFQTGIPHPIFGYFFILLFFHKMKFQINICLLALQKVVH